MPPTIQAYQWADNIIRNDVRFTKYRSELASRYSELSVYGTNYNMILASLDPDFTVNYDDLPLETSPDDLDLASSDMRAAGTTVPSNAFKDESYNIFLKVLNEEIQNSISVLPPVTTPIAPIPAKNKEITLNVIGTRFAGKLSLSTHFQCTIDVFKAGVRSNLHTSIDNALSTVNYDTSLGIVSSTHDFAHQLPYLLRVSEGLTHQPAATVGSVNQSFIHTDMFNTGLINLDQTDYIAFKGSKDALIELFTSIYNRNRAYGTAVSHATILVDLLFLTHVQNFGWLRSLLHLYLLDLLVIRQRTSGLYTSTRARSLVLAQVNSLQQIQTPLTVNYGIRTNNGIVLFGPGIVALVGKQGSGKSLFTSRVSIMRGTATPVANNSSFQFNNPDIFHPLVFSVGEPNDINQPALMSAITEAILVAGATGAPIVIDSSRLFLLLGTDAVGKGGISKEITNLITYFDNIASAFNAMVIVNFNPMTQDEHAIRDIFTAIASVTSAAIEVTEVVTTTMRASITFTTRRSLPVYNRNERRAFIDLM